MERLDLPVLILLVVFIGALTALFVFYLRGDLDYSSSLTQEVFGELRLFLNENWFWVVFIGGGIIFLVLVLRVFFAVWRRVNRKKINAGVVRRVEREVLGGKN